MPNGGARRCCDRCGTIIMGHINIIDVSRMTIRGPDFESWRVCSECADAVRAFLTAAPAELARLEPVEIGAGLSSLLLEKEPFHP